MQFFNGVTQHFEEEGFYEAVMTNDLKRSPAASG